MKLEWKTIKATRHVHADGRAICGKTGGYTDDPALPCEKCLVLLFALQHEAFNEDVAEVM
jgi:hypothetical protein